MLKEKRYPDVFHSSIKDKDYFEGWYFKIVSSDNKAVFAIIPGISRDKHEGGSHSFIQLLNGVTNKYSYIRYDISDFDYKKNEFDICVEKNKFSINGININLNTKNDTIKGNIIFKNIKKWPDSILNPGSMGFYNYLAFMECYSQVCAVDGEIEGSLFVNKKEYNFNGGKVYIEKNWGRAFPESWIWIQSNSFEQSNISFTCSLGKVPFFTGSFEGFLVALMINNKFYKFTTINKSKMKVEMLGSDVKLSFKRRNILLTVITKSEKERYMLCYGPKNGRMVPLVNETLNGRVKLELINEKNGEIIFKGNGYCCGIEYGGLYSLKDLMVT